MKPIPNSLRRACAKFIASALIALAVAVTPSRAAESPLYIPFQGQVTNQTGAIVSDGQYSVIFNLYDQAVGGQPVWSERHVKIGVTRGMINVFLGSISPLNSVDFSQTKYLGITVDTDNLATTADPEMVPRSLIMPAFHAKKADDSSRLAGADWTSILTGQSNDPRIGTLRGDKLANGSIDSEKIALDAVQTAQIKDSAVSSDKILDGTITISDLSATLKAASIIPPGTIMPFAGHTDRIPVGWLLCDGSALRSSHTAYTSLYSAIEKNWGGGTVSAIGALYPAIAAGIEQTDFNIPDLRGYFLRGVDGPAGRDPNSTTRTGMLAGSSGLQNRVGSVQVDAFQGHWHNLVAEAWGINTQQTDSNWMMWNESPGPVKSGGSYVQNPVSDGTNGSPRTSEETRPKNAYVNYIIKY